MFRRVADLPRPFRLWWSQIRIRAAARRGHFNLWLQFQPKNLFRIEESFMSRRDALKEW